MLTVVIAIFVACLGILFLARNKEICLRTFDIQSPIHTLLQKAFAIKINFYLLPKLENGKLVFFINHLHLFVRMEPKEKRSKNALLNIFISCLPKSLFICFGKLVAKAVFSFVAVRCKEVCITLAPHRKNAVYSEDSIIDSIKIVAKNLDLSKEEFKVSLLVQHLSSNSNVSLLETEIHSSGYVFSFPKESLNLMISPEMLATIGAFIDDSESEAINRSSDISFEMFNGLKIKPFRLDIKFVLSACPLEFSYFESVQLVLEDFEVSVQNSILSASSRKASFITHALDIPGEKVSCKAYRLLELNSRPKEHILISASKLIANIYLRRANFGDFGSISFAKAKEFIDLLGTDKFDYRSFMPTRKKQSEQGLDHSVYFTIDVEADQVAFQCAYEYPLTLVFDELVNVIKGCFGIIPSSLNGKLIINHCYILLVRTRKALFTLADGNFERRLETCYFNKTRNQKNKAFESPMCFEISGSDLEFIVKWEKKLLANLKSFSDLINRIEKDDFITEEHCRMLGTCLGGVTELHATELSVILKDCKEVPLVKAPELSIMGLLFLLEIEPYKEAFLEIPLCLNHFAENQINTFQGSLTTTKVITPIKLFHALMGNIYSVNQNVPQVNYNVYWTETFETVSRAFDVFSSPPFDPSPVMSVFDKLPYIFRGCQTTLAVRGRCRVRIDFDPLGEEVLELQLQDGLSVRMHEGSPMWIAELSGGKVVTDSRILRPFQRILAEEDLPLDVVVLPACTAGLDFSTNEKCSHWRVRPMVNAQSDTYHEYRTRFVKLKIGFAFDPKGQVRLNYHRQVEDWLARLIKRLSGVSLKTGRLWSSYLIPQIPPAEGFSLCLQELRLHLQFPCSLDVTFVTITEEHVLLRLNASHGEFWFGFGRKSYQAGFQMVYSDSDYNEISVQVCNPQELGDKWKNFLRSDRLAYVAAAEDYLAEKSCDTVLEHLAQLQERQDERRLKHVQRLLERVKEGKELLTRRRFMVSRAYITWDEDLRNAIFKLIDAQLMYEMGNRAQLIPLGSTEKTINEMNKKMGAIHEHSKRVDSPHEQAQQMIEDLLKDVRNGPFMARKELFEKREACQSDTRSPKELATELGLKIFSTTIVEINDVQIGLSTTCKAGLRKGQPEAVILSLPSIKFTTILLHDLQATPLFRRSVVELNNAKVSIAYYKFFPDAEWPPFVRNGVNEEYFIGVTNKINVKVVYDSAWNSMDRLVVNDFELRGSRILVECPAFELQCSNEEYYVIYELILNLLVYRDPNMARRSQNISRLVQNSDFHDGQQLLAKIRELKEDLAENDILSEEWEVKRELLYGLSEIVNSWQSLREKQEQKQSRLELLVILRKLSWQLALRGTYVVEATITEIVDNWISEENGSMSNCLELQSITAKNIMPGAFYRTMLSPLTEGILHRLQIEHGGEPLATANYGSQLRLFVRTSFPDVGKMCVEHAEIDVSPMFARVTQEIVEVLFEFFFPPESDQVVPGKEDTEEDNTKQYFSFVVIPPSRHLISFKLPSFEYHNELLSWRELLLLVRKDALYVLMRNAGSLLVEKMKRIGQSNLPEGADPMSVFYKLEQLPADPHIMAVEEDTEGKKVDDERKKKLNLLFGDMLNKK